MMIDRQDKGKSERKSESTGKLRKIEVGKRGKVKKKVKEK